MEMQGDAMAKGYTEEQIQQVLEGNDIIDVVAQYVPLKKNGHRYVGRCPFHNEKTPSFSVSADKQLYYCFGCGAGGDVITFVRNLENLTFVESVQHLAERANISLPDGNHFDDEESRKRDSMYRLHKDAARFYYKQRLVSPKAQDYLRIRGIDEETAKLFGLGYANSSDSGLYNYLRKKGYQDWELSDSGLVFKNQNGNGYRDRFRDRIMFPIVSVAKNVTGFGGRLLEKSDRYPKYLNSSDSLIFHKGSQLYGLNLAKTNLQDGRLIAVEGYMDVISLYQSGIKNVVASLGTALTEGQGRLMKRYVEEVVLCYDGDAAGIKAALRGIQVLEGTELRVKVMKLKDNMDPDDFVRKEGTEAFLNLVEHAMSTVDFRIDLLKKDVDLQRNEEKIRFVLEATKVLNEIKNSVEQEIQVHQFAKEMSIDPGVIFKEMKKMAVPESGAPATIISGGSPMERKNVQTEAQEILIGWLFSEDEPGKKLNAKIKPEHFQKGLFRDAARFALESVKSGKKPSSVGFLGTLERDEDRQRMSKVFMEGTPLGDDELEPCMRAMEVSYIKRYIANLQKKMRDFNLSQEEFNRFYCDLVEKKKDLEQLQSTGRENL